MIELRPSNQRGKANFGWLKSQHSFSFASYYDPQHMGFSDLRVINDDFVAPGAGFDTHGHQDMEIISLVLEGAIEHKDSTGNKEVLPAGEFQLMSAGRGIMHSEYNASKTEPLKFLQIWIKPNTLGNAPEYQQKAFGKENGLTTIITPTGENGTLQIKQDAKLHQLILASGSELKFDNSQQRNIYVHLIAGELNVNGAPMQAGDGAKISDLADINFANNTDKPLNALIFELA